MNTIRPDLLAGKIEALENDCLVTYPSEIPAVRCKELLWFIQALSMGRRGLDEIVEALIANYPGHFTTKGMSAAGVPVDGRYTLAQCLVVFKEAWNGIDVWRRMNGKENVKADTENFTDWLVLNVDGALTLESLAESSAYNRAAIEAGFERFNWPFLKTACESAARCNLGRLLHDLCTDKNTGFWSPWYCNDLTGLLLEFMGDYAAQRRKEIAQTEVTRIVFRELDFASSQNVPVPIIGESRIGKSKPASTWCAMRPGRARLVTVPPGNRMRDFIEAHADAFGIEYTPATTTAALMDLVKYVYFHSGLFICYDESQFLVPANYHKTTPPARLDFVRCKIIDIAPGRERGCGLIATPQSYRQTLDQYVKTTGYRIEQWLGRITKPVILPPDLGKEDVLAVARLHFPGINAGLLRLIVAKALQSEGYIKNMELTAKRALFIAQENGRAQPIEEDVSLAIEEIMPGGSASAVQTPALPAAAAVMPPRVRRSKADAPRVSQNGPVDPPETLSHRSLNSSCPVRGGIALESAA